MVTDIDKQRAKFLRQEVSLITALTLATIVVMAIWQLWQLTVPLIVGVLFAVAMETADIMVWHTVARKHSDSMPTFMMAVSGVRLLCGLVVLFILYFIVSKVKIPSYFVMFAVFYLMTLCHHSYFFTHSKEK